MAPCRQVLAGHDGEITAAAFASLPGGHDIVVTGGEDGTVRRWDVQLAAEGIASTPPLPVESVAILSRARPAGTQSLVVAGAEGQLQIRNLADGAPAGRPLGHGRSSVDSLKVADIQGRDLVVAVYWEGDAVLWDVRRRDMVMAVRDRRVKSADALVLRDGQPVMVFLDVGGRLEVRDIADGSRLVDPVETGIGGFSDMDTAMLADGTAVVVLSTTDRLQVWSIDDLRLRAECDLKDEHGMSKWPDFLTTVVLRDGRVTALVGSDDDMTLWDLDDLSPVVTLPGSGLTGPCAATVLSDGRRIVVGADNRPVPVLKAWELDTATPLRTVETTARVKEIAITPAAVAVIATDTGLVAFDLNL